MFLCFFLFANQCFNIYAVHYVSLHSCSTVDRIEAYTYCCVWNTKRSIEWSNDWCRWQSDGVFRWDSNQQGVILASFYYGYLITPFISAMLAMKFGGKLLVLISQTWVASLTLLTPVLTTLGDLPALVVVRIVEGLGQVNCLCALKLFYKLINLQFYLCESETTKS